ncbi:MAG: glycosyltransferase family 2 protein [Pyrinomonadaceae bacterium]
MKSSVIRANIILLLLVATIVTSIYALVRGDVKIIFLITLGYLAYEVVVNVWLFTASAFGIRKFLRASQTRTNLNSNNPTVTVLIAAHNEASCIETTLRSVINQRDVRPYIMIASDGSRDGMNELLIANSNLQKSIETLPDDKTLAVIEDSTRQLQHADAQISFTRWRGFATNDVGARIVIELLALPKIGKGAALNEGLRATETQILVTLDADTKLDSNAVAEIARTFENEKTVAAGGFIYVRDAESGGWLTRFQYVEFLRNFMWRIGLVNSQVCLQVSGAFGAFRTNVLRALGGFDANSLVEDYEIIYRFHERLRGAKQAYEINIAPHAIAYTDVPHTARAFIHQRTRWFAGFLQTLWQYRRMIGAREFGLLGLWMLPVKAVDAILPVWGLVSLLILLTSLAIGRASWTLLALMIFVAKWLFDVLLSFLMLRQHRKLFPVHLPRISTKVLLVCLFTESFGFQWFRQIAVINAYGWCIRRVRRWEQNRWTVNTPSTELQEINSPHAMARRLAQSEPTQSVGD